MSSITREQVLTMPLSSIFAAVKNPETQAVMVTLMKDREVAVHVNKLLQERSEAAEQAEAQIDQQLSRVVPPSTEQLAAEAAAMAETPVVSAEVPAVPVTSVAKPWEAEDAALKLQGVTVTRDESGVPTRYSQEYQVRDEDGTPIGRPTYLSARTLVEFLAKKDEAHISATRAFYRLKKQKLTFKQEKQRILTPEEISEAARVALGEKDQSKVEDVINATIESAFEKRGRELREKELINEGKAISNEFMRRHLHDYNPCEANKKAMGEYFAENNLEFTLDNLEAALLDLMSQEGKLVKVEAPFTARQVTEPANPGTATTVTATETPAIPASAAAAAVTASAAPAQPAAPSQPAVEATAPTPVAAHNVQPAARRPGVNGGIAPGTLSAQRPGTPDPVLARKEFLQTVKKMDPAVMRAKLKNDPQFVQQLKAYGIKIQ
jgi:hypothetical protein